MASVPGVDHRESHVIVGVLSKLRPGYAHRLVEEPIAYLTPRAKTNGSIPDVDCGAHRQPLSYLRGITRMTNRYSASSPNYVPKMVHAIIASMPTYINVASESCRTASAMLDFPERGTPVRTTIQPIFLSIDLTWVVGEPSRRCLR